MERERTLRVLQMELIQYKDEFNKAVREQNTTARVNAAIRASEVEDIARLLGFTSDGAGWLS